MAVFNNNPSEFVDFNNLFPVLNEKVGLTYEQWRKAIENINFVKANLGVSDVDKGNVNITVVEDDTQVGLDITTREGVVEKNGVQRTVIYIDFDLKVPSGKVKSVNGKDGAVELTAEDVGAISVDDLDIKHLVGTEDKPINLATDLEAQRYYLLSGVYSLDPIISTTLPNYTLARKMDATTVVFMNMRTESAEGIGSYLTLTIAGSGRVTNVRVGEVPNINGTFYGTTPEIYVPTSSGALGQILASGGDGAEPTWVDMPESGMPTLVGTEDAPINVYTDMEIGKLYSISGYIGSWSSTNKGTILHTADSIFYVAFRSTKTNLMILSAIVNFSAKTINQYDGTIANIVLSSDEYLSSYSHRCFPNQINGGTAPSNIYAPTSYGGRGAILVGSNSTSSAPWWLPRGNSGQVLFSGTSNSEPYWGDLPSYATTADIEAAIGNVSSLLGDTDDLEV